jgi:hypothetical protein
MQGTITLDKVSYAKGRIVRSGLVFVWTSAVEVLIVHIKKS